MIQRLCKISKKMCENLPVFKLPNEGDDLVLEIDASNKHWTQYSKSQKAKNFVNIAVEVLIG